MDNKLKEIYRKIFLIILVGLMIITCVYIYLNDSNTLEKSLNHVKGDPIAFNYESGFYNHDLEIKIVKDIELPLATKIYYTIDGNNPTDKSILYENVINLELDSTKTKVIPLKVVLYLDGEYSEIYQKTYVIDNDFDTHIRMNIASITCDYKDLYDYSTGIMVAGKTYDDEIIKNPDAKKQLVGNYRNRGEEWIKSAKMCFFSNDGEILNSLDIGLGISGGTSSSLNIKSLKLIANYKNDNKFKYNAFYTDKDKSKNSMVSEFNNVRLRSGSQDRTITNIKSSFVSKIAEQSNFDGGTTTDRVIVYLNGNFYGIHDFQLTYSESTLARKYSLDDSEKIEKHKSREFEVLNEAGIYDLFKADLNNIENQKKLEKRIDIDNMILYYAINILGNNTDWPDNNYEIWKYNGEYNSNNKYTDGKYRFLIYDTDMYYYSDDLPQSTEGFSTSCFRNILNGTMIRSDDSVFLDIIGVEKYRSKFITVISDLMNTSFDIDNLNSIIDCEYNKIKYLNDDEKRDNYIISMKEKAKNVLEDVDNVMDEYFELTEKYDLTIKCEKGIKAYWNNMEVFEDNSYSNKYYKGVSFEMSYEEYPGYEFDYWLVNDKKIYDKNLNINDELIKEDRIDIKLVAKRNDNIKLIISEINAKDDSDWIKLTNIGEENIELSDYYISDNEKKLLKNQLPKLLLQSGESVIINGNKNYFATGDYICNFNLSQGETLYLYNVNSDEIEDSIVIPRMSSIETYGRYLNSGTYMFFNNMNNVRKISNY